MNGLRRSIQLLSLLALGGGCSQVLGIEDAHVDSALLGGSGGNTSPSGTSEDAGAGVDSAAGKTVGQGGSVTTSGGSGGSSGSTPEGSEAGDKGEGGAPPTATLCESYCDAVMSNCKGKYEQYRTFDQCVEVCKRLPEGESGDEDVNSVQCRVRQAQFAESEPFVYCKSAGPLGAGKCGSNCVAYCSLMQTTCTAESTDGNLELSYFDDSQSCLAACGAIPSHEDDPAQYSSSATASPSCFVGNTVY